MGFYATLYLFSKLISGGKKKTDDVTISKSNSIHTPTGEMPSVDSPDFDKWISTPGNIEKLSH
jgi:hypothetical protein